MMAEEDRGLLEGNVQEWEEAEEEQGEDTRRLTDRPTEERRERSRRLNAQVRIVLFGFLPITIEPLLALSSAALGLTSSAADGLLYNKTCLNLYNHTVCENLDNDTFSVEKDAVQSLASRWTWYRNAAWTVPAMFSVAIAGHWGDRHGRKVPMIIPLVGDLGSLSAYLLLGIYIDSSLVYTLIPAFVTGLTGGMMSSRMSAFSYLTDVTAPENRVFRLIIVDTVAYISAGASAFVSGYFIDRTNYVTVYTTALAIFILAIFYVVFGIKDIIPEQNTAKSGALVDTNTRDGCTGAVHVFVLFKERGGHNRAHILIAVLGILLHIMASANGITFLYFKNTLHWSQTIWGYFSGYTIVLHGVSLVFSTLLLKKVFRVRDTTLMVLASISQVPQGVLLALCSHTWMVFLVPICDPIGLMLIPTIRGFLSNLVNPWEQGKLFSVITTLESLGSLAASSFYETFLYPQTLAHLPGMCFFFSSGMKLIPLALFIGLHIDVKLQERRRIRQLQEIPAPPQQEQCPECTDITRSGFKGPTYLN